MKYLFLFLIVFLVALHLGQVRFFDEYLAPEQELGIVVNVLNYNDEDLENVKVSVFIPAMGYYFRSGAFDVDKNDVYGKLIYDEVPKYAEPGDYLAKVTISNDDIKESVYRYITIV